MPKRKRISITLKKEILDALDQMIDHQKIRNRSQAIEYILSQALLPKIKKCFILAGGKGKKIRPFSFEIPKPMLPVKGKPILEWQIELLRENDIREIIILVGHLGEKIKYHFGDGKNFGVKISYLEQKEKEIGNVYALYLARPFLEGESFLMLYGDILIEIDLKEFMNFHLSSKNIATIALTTLPEVAPYGVVKLKGSKIVSFKEKPKEAPSSRVISAGLFCFEPEIFKFVSKSKKERLEEKVFPQLAKEGKLGGYVFEGKWFDIGTQEDYEKALKEWKK